VGLSKGKYILKGDVMFIENFQRSADDVCSRDRVVEGLHLGTLLTLKVEKCVVVQWVHGDQQYS
jgi:hypothetical protein